MDKRTIIYVILLGALLIFWFPLMQRLGVMDSDSPTPVVDSTEVKQPESSPTTTENQLNSDEPVSVSPEEMNEVALSDLSDTVEANNLPVDTTIIRTDNYTITMTSLGGGPVSFILNNYSYRNDEPIQMLPEATEATPSLTFANGSFNTSRKHFTSSKYPGEYDVTSEPLELIYTWESDAGTTLKKIYRFYPDEYHYDLKIELLYPEKQGLGNRYSLVWNSPLGVTEPQPKTDYDAMEAAAMLGNSREKLDDWDDGRLRQSMDGYVKWGGVRSKYFAGLFIPKSREGESFFARGTEESILLDDGSTVTKKEITAGVDMSFAASVVDSFQVFVGPLEYKTLTEYNVELEDILDIGTTPFVGWIIKLFAIPIMLFLPWLYQYIPNYGVVIIIFAILVKVITLPLSAKSFKSMNAMKELQPKMDAMKKKYKDNPQQLNSEMMKLYKAHGVNPIGGCLPMLPQMPLFFALFSVFRSTILLRNAPFFWFIDDLSRGANSYTDPYMILVVIMVAGQFVSQKLTMASTQQNKMLMYAMPLFMGWIFHSFAAGLVLYWACFSILSLLDYVVFKRDTIKNAQIKTAGK